MRHAKAVVWLCLVFWPAAHASGSCPATAELTVRNGHAMAYAPDPGVVLLFGGADESRVMADLWAWNGAEWRCLAPGGPPARTFAALAWDGERTILFGGNAVLFGAEHGADTFLDDMWQWDGRRWRVIDGAVPSARAEAGAAWDRHRRRVVLFGGYRDVDGERVRLGDTWEWDGVDWEQVSDGGPGPRNGAALAYDEWRKVVVLFGGNGPAKDTWEWDGRRWRTVATAEDGRFNPGMAFDPGQRAVIRFGGWTGTERAGDTWRYDGSTWTLIEPDGPSARNHAPMALDARRQVIVLFGGHDGERVFGDTWEWQDNAWSPVSEPLPRRRVDNGH